ncbi:hypothetical protein CK516_11110 [Nostoc sp. 'Peltigera malacea cyanobiont' DB3992]|nr:hypothetical protein CK516_11110 [Nostoc sp. 'Peltigera malacea cyanobiont' DB3992]
MHYFKLATPVGGDSVQKCIRIQKRSLQYTQVDLVQSLVQKYFGSQASQWVQWVVGLLLQRFNLTQPLEEVG